MLALLTKCCRRRRSASFSTPSIRGGSSNLTSTLILRARDVSFEQHRIGVVFTFSRSLFATLPYFHRLVSFAVYVVFLARQAYNDISWLLLTHGWGEHYKMASFHRTSSFASGKLCSLFLSVPLLASQIW